MAEDHEFGRVRPSGLVPSPSLASRVCDAFKRRFVRARYRCTRCGENEINARANGCARGPCPMEYVG